MLKIKDSNGKVVGVLRDEDTEPEMQEKFPKKEKFPEEETEVIKEGDKDANSEATDVCRV